MKAMKEAIKEQGKEEIGLSGTFLENMTADSVFVQTLEKSLIKQNLIHFPYPESQTA